MTKAHIYNTGLVTWEPPVIYNSMCPMNIRWFPFDEQFCELKFGSWTYGPDVNLSLLVLNSEIKKELDKDGNVIQVVERAIELSDYQESTEWDLMSVRGIRHEKYYPCCPNDAYIDITYYVDIRRKTLFYTANMIVPCVGIAFMSSAIFYLPSDSKAKINLCVSVLVSLALFFLLLTDIIPPISLAVPLISIYLLYTMILVSLSIVASVMTIHIHYQAVMAYPMPGWIKFIFISFLPKILFLTTRRYNTIVDTPESLKCWRFKETMQYFTELKTNLVSVLDRRDTGRSTKRKASAKIDAIKACQNVCYTADTVRQSNEGIKLKEDWKLVAIVIDRILLLAYSVVIGALTIYVFVAAPMFHDHRIPVSKLVKKELANKNSP